MRGMWIINLGRRVLNGEISLPEASRFILARINSNPVDISLNGVLFPQADHNLWSIIADIIINQEYFPPGFEIGLNDIVVDIGAHKGVFSAYAQMKTNNRVLGFEPLPDNYAYFCQLVEAQGWKNVEPLNLAISDSEGEAKLFTGQSTSRNSLLGKDIVSSTPLSQTIIVHTTTLDKVLQELPQVDFLKMDCEGAEFRILQNCSEDTFRKIKKISMEFHAEQGSLKLLELIELLKRHYSNVEIRYLPGVPLGYIYAN